MVMRILLIVVLLTTCVVSLVVAQEPAPDYLAIQARAQIAAANELYSIRLTLVDLTRVQLATAQEIYRARTAEDRAAEYHADFSRGVMLALLLFGATLAGGGIAAVAFRVAIR